MNGWGMNLFMGVGDDGRQGGGEMANSHFTNMHLQQAAFNHVHIFRIRN